VWCVCISAIAARFPSPYRKPSPNRPVKSAETGGFATAGLEACGVDLYLDQQIIDTTTPVGKLLFQITGAFAEFERTARA
jgi:Resolvase, N terminal domain